MKSIALTGDAAAAALLEDLPEAQHAREAGLIYVNDAMPGYGRVPTGRGFRYLDSDGRRLTDPKIVDRIRTLAIPPAWRGVWICRSRNGHIQATGRDEKGRKQYIYHEEWRRVRDLSKYDRMIAFARLLPRLRARVARDMRKRDISREKVLATVVSLLDRTQIRVGNGIYAKENGSFGLTTLRPRHLDVSGNEVKFNFKGKSGRIWRLSMKDRRIARIVRSLQELPGQQLFQYQAEDGTVRAVDSSDVNDYLRETTGEDITAKDFRTWAGTVVACVELSVIGKAETKTALKANLSRAVKAVAAKLGNTAAVCRKCYIHPEVFVRYEKEGLPRMEFAGLEDPDLLKRAEQAVLRLLARRRRG